MTKQPVPANPYKLQLQADFPDLDIQTVEEIGQGYDHVAVLVNSSIIFRLPREVLNLEQLAKSVAYETALLRRLQHSIPAALPNPLYIAPGNAYFGYPQLPGTLLVNRSTSIDFLDEFSDRDKAWLREDWADIAAAIHQSIPVEYGHQLGVPDFNVSKFISNSQRIFELPGINRKIQDFAQSTIEAAQAIDMDKEPLVFIHNDLGFHNLLAGLETKRICAVIDWTDCCIAPVSREFSVWEWTHNDSLAKVASRYEHGTGIKINQHQASTWAHLEALSEFVEQTENNKVELAEFTLNHIEQWVGVAG